MDTNVNLAQYQNGRHSMISRYNTKNDIKINVKEKKLLGHDVNEYAWKNKQPPQLELNLPDYHGCKSVK